MHRDKAPLRMPEQLLELHFRFSFRSLQLQSSTPLENPSDKPHLTCVLVKPLQDGKPLQHYYDTADTYLAV